MARGWHRLRFLPRERNGRGLASFMAADPFAMNRWTAKVFRHRQVSSTAYELTLSRDGLQFRAGQLITIHGRDITEDRNYSIASGENDDALTVLYRLIPDGVLTPRLVRLAEGDSIDVSGPYGEFVIRDLGRPLVFVATGTGIAPCRAYARTHPGLDLTILHGVRRVEDLFFRSELEAYHYFPCVSGESSPWFRGRVTEFARSFNFPPDADFYLCGANEMFYEMREILTERGISPHAIFTEAYYYTHDA